MLRHELSAIFGDMPNTEYASLLKSVQDNGFTHPKIITFEDKILDGWHRFRVAEHLGKESDLIFEELSGVDPAEFVLAENLYRRHMPVSQRAQIVDAAYAYLSQGGDRRSDGFKSSNDELKSREELAEIGGVSTASIDRARQVSRAGRSEEVIAGEKSASAVIQEEREKAAPLEQDDSIFWRETDKGLVNNSGVTAKGEYVGVGGVKNEDDVNPVPTSEPTSEPVPEPTEGDFLRVVLDSDMVIHDNALAMSSGILRKMPDMSARGWKALRRNVLRVVHPDKVNMSDWTDAEKDSWTVLFEFMNDFLGELERDYREYAEIKSKGGS